MVVLTTKAQSFLEQVKAKADTITCTEPQPTDPLSIGTAILKDKVSDSVAVIVKASIYSGWHIYAFVPEDMPYIVTLPILRTSSGEEIQVEWIKSAPQPSLTDKGVLVYENKASFLCFLKKGTPTEGLQAALSYQACDVHQCLPPKEKTMSL